MLFQDADINIHQIVISTILWLWEMISLQQYIRYTNLLIMLSIQAEIDSIFNFEVKVISKDFDLWYYSRIWWYQSIMKSNINYHKRTIWYRWIYSDLFNRVNILRNHWLNPAWRLGTQSACIFSVILHRNPLKGVSLPAEFLHNLTKNLTAHLAHRI